MSSQTTMPETDWLTGLSSRAAFARQVNQADRDRERFSVGVIAIEDFAEVNRRQGHEAGDDLLRAIGRALSLHTSVNTVAARLEGTRFGMLGLHVDSDDVQQWLRPAVSAAKAAVSDWTFDQIDFAGDCPVEPLVMAGAASGSGSGVWVDAVTAVEVATQAGGSTVVQHRSDDPRFAAIARRNDQSDRVVAALEGGTLWPMAYRIDLAGGGDRDWSWLRLMAGLDQETPVPSGSELPGGAARRVERWLLEQAGDTIAKAGGLLRLTVPVAGEVQNGRAFAERMFPLLERQRIPPSRILFELTETVLLEAETRGWEFVRQIDKIGAGVVLADCRGGWQTWQAIEHLPIGYLKPDAQLTERAATGTQAARRIVSAMAKNAADAERELLAPPVPVAKAILADLGFSYLEVGQPERIDEALSG